MRTTWTWCVIALVALGACGSAQEGSADPPDPTVTETVPMSSTEVDIDSVPDPQAVPEVDHDVVLIESRLLGEDIAVGDPWTVAVIAPGELGAALPDAEIDADNEVLFRFTLAESGSAALSEACAQGPFQGLAFRASDARLFPITTPGWQRVDGGGEIECTADANAHSIFVAVAREDLPVGEFEIWLSGNDAPSGVAGNVVRVPAGELRAPDPLASDVAEFVPGELLAPLDVRNIYRVSTHCGLSRLFLEINGTQWLAPPYSLDAQGVPVTWSDDVRGEEIDLRVKVVDDGQLLVSSLGSGIEITYRPAPDELGCA